MNEHVAHPLVQRIRSIIADPFLVAPDDLPAETDENTYLVSASSEEARSVLLADVVAAVSAVADARRGLLRAGGWEHEMTFYVWHDAQAGQLRLSSASAAANDLPFGCDLDLTATLDSVVEAFIGSPWLDGIAISELDARLVDAEQDGGVPDRLPVYIEALRGNDVA